MLLWRNMSGPCHPLRKNNVHMQRGHVVLQILASSAVLLIWNSWPCYRSSSCSCSWHCVEKKQTAAKRCQGCAGSCLVCLFVCLPVQQCAAVTTTLNVRWFSHYVIAADLICLCVPFFILTWKTKCKNNKKVLWLCVTVSSHCFI